jgi:hypothetical protein
MRRLKKGFTIMSLPVSRLRKPPLPPAPAPGLAKSKNVAPSRKKSRFSG